MTTILLDVLDGVIVANTPVDVYEEDVVLPDPLLTLETTCNTVPAGGVQLPAISNVCPDGIITLLAFAPLVRPFRVST